MENETPNIPSEQLQEMSAETKTTENQLTENNNTSSDIKMDEINVQQGSNDVEDVLPVKKKRKHRRSRRGKQRNIPIEYTPYVSSIEHRELEENGAVSICEQIVNILGLPPKEQQSETGEISIPEKKGVFSKTGIITKNSPFNMMLDLAAEVQAGKNENCTNPDACESTY